MADISHIYGEDLSISSTGDIACATGTQLCRQRVIKRLLTNTGDYIWSLDYGAGLGAFIGQPALPDRIRATIRSQIFKEAAVARSPEPQIEVSFDQTGILSVYIRYSDASSGDTQALTFTTGAT